MPEIENKGENFVKKLLLGVSPPFSAFLIDTLNTGRVLVIEKQNTSGATYERAGSA